MAEDPEEMLPEERVGAHRYVEEIRVERSVKAQQDQSNRDDRQSEQK